MRLKNLLLPVLLLLAASVSAQVVNTEKKRKDQSEDGWIGSADVGLSLIRNTREIFQVTNRINVQYRKKKHMLLILNDLRLMSVNKDRLLNRGFQHVRYNYEFRPYLIPEAFVQAQYDQIWKIDLRTLAGAGPRFRIHRTDSSNLYLGVLLMYEYEEISGGVDYNRDVRLSAYLSAGFNFNRIVGLSHITYFQPRIDDFRDFRVSTETALSVSLTTRLGFKTTFSLSYDTRPPEGIFDTQYAFVNALFFNF